MDANTIGGVVNLKLREAPTGFHFDVLAQGNYNSTDHLSDNYKFWVSVSDRFLDDKLGVFLQGNMDRTNGGNQQGRINIALDSQGDKIKDGFGNAVYRTTKQPSNSMKRLPRPAAGVLYWIINFRMVK